MYLDMLLKLDADGKLTTQLYNKKDINCYIVNFSCLYSTIASALQYEVYNILQLIWYARALLSYDRYLIQSSLLTNTLILQGFVQYCLQKSPQILRWLQRFSLPIQPFFRPNTV
jgi:hypothetical protein